jgi:hypothetical protein
MPRVGFEPTIPVFERAKTVHALDCVAIVIGIPSTNLPKFAIAKISQLLGYSALCS